MSDATLFSHLIQRFREPAEYLATEALGFVLDRSPACRRALRDLALACGAPVDETIVYRTQVVAEDGARPDVVGSPPSGKPQVILEGKFWAGLTKNQPRAYLAEMGRSQPGILFMVVPAERITALWPEVRELCVADGITITNSTNEEDLVAAPLASGHVLAMVSWRLLLARMATAAEAAREARVREDIAQLQSLCDAQDRLAFLPLRREELTDQTLPARMAGYYQLATDAVQQAVNARIASRDGLRSGGGFPKRFGPYLYVGSCGGLLAVALDLWAEYGHGPLWLCLQDFWWSDEAKASAKHDQFAEVARRLSPLAPGARGGGERGPVLLVPSDGWPVVALPLPIGAERHHVVDSVVGQLRDIHDLLAGITFSGSPSAFSPPSDPTTSEVGEGSVADLDSIAP